MTREQIEAKWQALSARERDAWVAEVVMGWTDFSPIDPSVGYSIGGGGFRRNYATNPLDGRNKPIPNYSTVMIDAWTIVDDRDPEYFELMRISSGWGCWVGGEMLRADSTTAPEAICLAALIAKLTEVAE